MPLPSSLVDKVTKTMALRHYPQVPHTAVLQFGGYRLVKPGAWEAYLDSLIQIEYPDFFQQQSGNEGDNPQWRSNACILESLEKYLFTQYGVSIPKDNLFKVYNYSGEGIPPEQLLEAIAAVIEPLGFEVDRVIVPDLELRRALGDDQRTVGLDQDLFFEGKPGLCMINIKPGESHAFFWERMDARRFHKEQFRMALTVKPAGSSPGQALSAEDSVQGYCKLLRDYLEGQDLEVQPGLAPLLNQVEALGRCVEGGSVQEGSFRQLVFNQVSSLLDLLEDLFRTHPKPNDQQATLIEAGELICKIYGDAPPLGAS